MADIKVPPELGSMRLDKVVAKMAGVPRRQARMWITSGLVRVGGKVLRVQARPVRAGQRLGFPTPNERGEEAFDGVGSPSERVPGERDEASGGRGNRAPRSASSRRPQIDVLHLDEHLVAINKPPHLLSERDRFGAPCAEDEVSNYLEEQGYRSRVWLVHRLDAPTSGVLVLARSAMAAGHFGDAFRARTTHKEYLALCQGQVVGRKEINAPVGRVQGTRHGVRRDGRPAATTVVPLATTEQASLVRLIPHTGRTHQLRVHMAHLGHPLFGDALYGGPRYTFEQPPAPIPRAMLHAHRLTLPHPRGGADYVLEAPAPDDFIALASALGVPAGLPR